MIFLRVLSGNSNSFWSQGLSLISSGIASDPVDWMVMFEKFSPREPLLWSSSWQTVSSSKLEFSSSSKSNRSRMHPDVISVIFNTWNSEEKIRNSNNPVKILVKISFNPISDAGVWRLNLGRGGAPKAPPPIWGTFSTVDPKNGSQPQNSPRLCYNIKRTKKLRATCCNWHLYVVIILASYCSRQGPPLRK